MSEDLISRQEVINRIEALMPPLPNGDYQEGIDLGLIMAKTAAKEQPSAQQKTGRWERCYDYFCRCSVCGVESIVPKLYNEFLWKYCPDCGAKMESEVE